MLTIKVKVNIRAPEKLILILLPICVYIFVSLYEKKIY